MEKHTVKLLYFKPGGKWAYEGEYQSDKEHLFQIWEEIETMFTLGIRPGLVDGQWNYVVTVDVPTHPHNHPHMIVPPRMISFLQELPWFMARAEAIK